MAITSGDQLVAEYQQTSTISNKTQPESATPITVREITSASLLQGEKEVLILHEEEVYRLKLTRNGKLILQK